MNNNEEKKLNAELEELEEEKEKTRLLESLVSYEGKDEVITSQQAFENIQKKAPGEKISSGITKLDSLTDGFREGDIVVISAPTKMGKTTFAQTLTHNLSEEDLPCLWFSYEMRPREFFMKFGEQIPYFLLPKALTGSSVQWIEERVIEAKAKYGAKAVFIDHLHYLLDFEMIQSRAGISLIIGGLMRELKKIALKWDLCLFLIAHTTKLGYDHAPELSDIRDSSFISQEADIVIMLQRMTEKGADSFTNETKLLVKANRRTGQTGSLKLTWRDNRFYEEDELYEKTDYQ